MEVTSIKPLLAAAIDSGESHGILVGDAAKFIKDRFKSAAPIEVDVRTLASLAQSGCRRLEVTTRQEGIVEASSQTPARRQLVFELSYCRDGSFATSKQ